MLLATGDVLLKAAGGVLLATVEVPGVVVRDGAPGVAFVLDALVVGEEFIFFWSCLLSFLFWAELGLFEFEIPVVLESSFFALALVTRFSSLCLERQYSESSCL